MAVQRTVPDSGLTTHLSLMPKETSRVAAPTLQDSFWSAHFEYPDGQSAAKAGEVLTQAMASMVKRRERCF